MVGGPAAHRNDEIMDVETGAAAADQQPDIAVQFDILSLAAGKRGIGLANTLLAFVDPMQCVSSRLDVVPFRMAKQGIFVDSHHRADER